MVMQRHYTGCKLGATINLHRAAFPRRQPCRIIPYMACKYPNRIREWRKHRGFTQRQLVARLIELNTAPSGSDEAPDNPDLKIPTTEASISRIEQGVQNFNMATLQAIAQVLDVEEAGWLLDRKPVSADVVDLVQRLNAADQEKAQAVLEALFKTGTDA